MSIHRITLAGRRVELRTTWPPARCRERLAQQLVWDAGVPGAGAGPAALRTVSDSRRPMCGYAGQETFLVRSRLRERRSFQTELRGRWAQGEDGGTLIHAVVGMNRATLAFMTAGSVFLLLLVLMAFGLVPFLGGGEAAPWYTRLAGLGLLVAWAVVWIGGRWWSRVEERELILFVLKTLRCDQSLLDQFTDEPGAPPRRPFRAARGS